MAMRSSKPAPGRRPAKPAKPERKVVRTQTVEVVEEKPGMPVEAVLSLITFVLLIAAILTMDYANGKNYGGGWFFKGKYEAAAAQAAQ